MPRDDLDETVLPFGAHKGKTLDQVPAEYLDWLVGQDWFKQKRDLYDKVSRYLEKPFVKAELEGR